MIRMFRFAHGAEIRAPAATETVAFVGFVDASFTENHLIEQADADDQTNKSAQVPTAHPEFVLNHGSLGNQRFQRLA